MKRISLLIAMIIFLVAIFVPSVSAEDSYLISLKHMKEFNQRHGTIIEQPNGPFAVMLFNEFALGSHIGIIYYKQMANPAAGKWWISERFWQKKPWRDCVTSFAWSHDGKHLYVGTSEVYGDGGSFKLDLFNRSYTRLYPKEDQDLKGISSTEILKIDSYKNRIVIEVTLADYKTVETVNIPGE
ncbi:MAG: hypothetical protein K9K88_17180 [Desulfobacterales bacterium]|nr:hypothetical protein [Desulfobacterales bacterium]